MDSSNRDGNSTSRIFSPQRKEPVLLGQSDCEDYRMDYPNKGNCYIFNHKNFKPELNLTPRKGTDYDAGRLYLRFQELGFHAEIFHDLTVAEIMGKIHGAGREDHSKSSCFVCCILTHGHAEILFAYDGIYQLDQVFSPFRGDNCPSLAGKPKLFFIQACQGDLMDPGVKVTFKESVDDGDESLKIPTCADFLVAYSTVPGYCAWKYDEYGSWFIQTLCTILQMYAKSTDLLQMLTIVNRKVALEFQSYCPDEPESSMKKQIPYFTSTLTRTIKFHTF